VSHSKSSQSILIACGGTGGHLYPGIAVAELLHQQGHRVTLLISEKKIDALAASGHPDLTFERLPALAMPKPWSPKMPGFVFSLWRGVRQCRRLIRENQIDAVLGMGGFTSFAPLYAGRKERCRTFIHESNAIPGKANRLNARYSDVVLCGLDACRSHFSTHSDVRTVGTPIRSNMQIDDGLDPYAFFRLKKDCKTLLVMGGSQGARGVNRMIGASLPFFEKMGLQILHITGPGDYEESVKVYADHPLLSSHVAAFCHRMDLAYRVADLAIARAGASTLAELAFFGVPSLLIPYPYAAEDHQTRNGEIFTADGAALMLPENTTTVNQLAAHIQRILLDTPDVAAAMKSGAASLATPHAAAAIAKLIVA